MSRYPRRSRFAPFDSLFVLKGNRLNTHFQAINSCLISKITNIITNWVSPIFPFFTIQVSSTVQERRRKRKAFLTEAQLRKLPVLHWRTSIPQDTCSICIENFEVGEEIRVLPCSHGIQYACLKMKHLDSY